MPQSPTSGNPSARRAAVLFLLAAGVLAAWGLRPGPDEEAELEYVEMMRANDQQMDAWGIAPPGALRLALQQKAAMAPLAASVPNAEGEWLEFGIGPLITDDPRYPSVNGLGIGFNAGRVDSFAYDPVGKRLFASVGTGGVWMTETLGNNWVSVGERLPTLIIGAVGWTSAGGGTLVAGSGEASNGGNAYVGMGAFWTNDLGATWNEATGVPDGAMTYQVAVDAGHPEIVYLGTSKGLYRSTDAGRNYTYVALPTGCNNLADLSCQFANWVTDVVVKAPGGTTNVTCAAAGCPVLAAVGYRGGRRAYLDGKVHSPNNGLYRSNTGEPGTFALLNVYGDGISNVGFATAERVGRTELGSATGPQQDHNYVYAMVQDAVRLNGGIGNVDVPGGGFTNPAGNPTTFNGIYVSPDFGTTWIRMADENELAQPSTGSSLATIQAASFAPGIQAWYNLFVTVDPTRADPSGVPTRIVFGLEEVWTNRTPHTPLNGLAQQGAEDFKVIGTYFSGTTCQFVGGVPACPTTDPPTSQTTTHPDQQDAIFIPDANGGVHLFVGNDGGVYTQHAVATTGEYDNSRWGKGVNHGFYTLLPYGIAAAKDCTVWFGLQDNGSGRIEPDTRKVLETFGGDGTMAAVDPANSNIAYTATPNGALRRTTNGGQTWTSIAPSQPTRELFVNPFVMDPTDAKHLMTGGPEIVEHLNAPGATTGNWTLVFNLGTAPPPGNEPRNMTALDLHGDAAYVGFCGLCNVFTTRTNTNQAFHNGIATNVGGSKPPKKGTSDGWHFATAAGLPNRYITSFEIDPADANTVYVTLSGYENRQWAPPGQYLDPNTNIGTGHVFKSTNAGESFVDVSGNLPDVPVFWVVLRAGQLIVGTQIGPFISSDTNGTLWAPLGTGLPNVPVVQLATWDGDLTHMFAATYGRGVWRYRFPGEIDVCPLPTPELIAAAPVLGNPSGVETPAGHPACGTDTNGAFTLNFTYSPPEGGSNPSGFRIESATRVEEAFFDDAEEMLSGGSNSTWQGTSGWTSQVNPDSGTLAYYVPDTLNQNETLTLRSSIPVPPGGALLELRTTQSTEPNFDFAYVEASGDDGANWATLHVSSGNFIGTRQFDLSSYAGGTVKLRLRFTSDSNTGLAGWWVEDLRITVEDFAPLADAPAGATSHALSGRPNGTRHYRVRGLFDSAAGTVAGPYSNIRCVTVAIPNTPPVANAGADFAVDEGDTAMLSGALSTDDDGDALGYSWEQIAGPTVTLADADTAAPSFTAPSVLADTELTFRLTVSDAVDSATDEVTVTVRDLNQPPNADAGADFSVDEGRAALLSGSGSTDPDGDMLEYQWQQLPGGPAVVLANANTATASFVAPEVDANTLLLFSLTVRDPSGAEDTDVVTVTVRNVPAVAGNTQILGGAVSALMLLTLGLGGALRAGRRWRG